MMRSVWKLMGLALCLPLLLGLAVPVVHAEDVTVAGTVEAAETDETGAVTAVAIAAADGRYLVAGDGAGGELLGQVGAEITATGSVEGEGDARTLHVSSWEPAAADEGGGDEGADDE